MSKRTVTRRARTAGTSYRSRRATRNPWAPSAAYHFPITITHADATRSDDAGADQTTNTNRPPARTAGIDASGTPKKQTR